MYVLTKRNLGVQSKTIDATNVNQSGVLKHRYEGLHAEEVVSGVLIRASRQRHVQHAHAVGLQRAFDLAHESFRVQRVIEHVREFEIERAVIKRLVVKVTLNDKRRVWNEVHSNGVTNADSPQRLHLLAHARAYAECLGRVIEKFFILKVLEEARENRDFAVPVAGCPYFSEARVEGLVELALDVGVVGGVTGSDS